MALPALDTAFADLKDLPQKQILATWLANKTGGAVADVLTLSEKQLWAELAVAYGGDKEVQGYEGIALQYSWAAIYNGITGGTDTHINWGIRQAMEAIVGAQYGVDVCCYTTGFPIQYLLAFMAISAATPSFPLENLLAFYKFNGDATDSSGNGYDCFTEDVTYPSGKISECITGDSVEGSYATSGATLSTSGSWTFSLWLMMSETTGSQVACYFGGPGGSGTIGIYAGPSHNNGIQIVTTSSALIEYPLSLGEWAHLIYTFNGSTGEFAVYINNSEIWRSFDDAIAEDAYLTVVPASDCKVDALGIWNAELNQSQRAAIYNSGNGLEP